MSPRLWQKPGLRQRFANPSLQHKTMQIASDASQKVPLRILSPLRELLAKKAECGAVIFAVALWIRSCAEEDEKGQPITILDPAFREWDAPVSVIGVAVIGSVNFIECGSFSRTQTGTGVILLHDAALHPLGVVCYRCSLLENKLRSSSLTKSPNGATVS